MAKALYIPEQTDPIVKAQSRRDESFCSNGFQSIAGFDVAYWFRATGQNACVFAGIVAPFAPEYTPEAWRFYFVFHTPVIFYSPTHQHLHCKCDGVQIGVAFYKGKQLIYGAPTIRKSIPQTIGRQTGQELQRLSSFQNHGFVFL